MDPAAISAAKLQQIGAQFQVNVLVSQKEQLKAVVGTLIESIQSNPLPEGKGQRLNVVA